MKEKIYFDHAASTPLDTKVFNAMIPYFVVHYGNPSSIHQFGQEALAGVDVARAQIASAIGAEVHEIFFTSGATESNNLAIQGVVGAWKKQNAEDAALPHIITSSIEHPSILEACSCLEKFSQVEMTSLPVSSDGLISLDTLRSSLKKNTILVSIMLANNEIGTIQPICEISHILKDHNNILFHSDATQALAYLECNVPELGADMLSFSGHKIFGPKGIGVLYVKEGTKIESRVYGGVQQNGLRPGTLPTPLIVGIGKAFELAHQNRGKHIKKVQLLQCYALRCIRRNFPEVRLNGSEEKRLPNNIHISFPWGDGESMLMALDLEGVAVSTGSACASGSLHSSHVLAALGIPQKYITNSLRITLGPQNTTDEIDYLVSVMKKVRARYQV